MNTIKNRSIFKQLQVFLPIDQLNVLISKHNGDYKVHQHTTEAHFKVILIAMITGLSSLRLIEKLEPMRDWLAGFGVTTVKRSTIARANNKRPNRIFSDLFLHMLAVTKAAAPKHRGRLRKEVKAFDSTTITLSQTLYDWATFKSNKGGIKMHTLFDVKRSLPEMVIMENARPNDVTVFRPELIPANTVVLMDRAYVDYKKLSRLNARSVIFVTRTKSHMRFQVVRELSISEADRCKGIIRDSIVIVATDKRKEYRGRLRVVVFQDPQTGKYYEFFTNNRTWKATTVADLYKKRWDIELFFKWIKQHLKIKTFFGHSRNAVYMQLWIALIYYLLLTLLKFRHGIKISLHDIHHNLRLYWRDTFDLVQFLKQGKTEPMDIVFAQHTRGQ